MCGGGRCVVNNSEFQAPIQTDKTDPGAGSRTLRFNKHPGKSCSLNSEKH